jgi:phosphohistidine phosphatase
MRIILFRHGLAIERDAFILQKKDDALRPLVEKGKERTRKMAKVLKEQLPEVHLLVTSPFVRAQQTAEILREILKPKRIAESLDLVPTAPPQAFAQWLKLHAKDALTVVVVGHEPQLTVFASWLLGGQMDSFIDLKKSGVICLELENFETVGPRTAEMRWALPPKFVT